MKNDLKEDLELYCELFAEAFCKDMEDSFVKFTKKNENIINANNDASDGINKITQAIRNKDSHE